MQGTIKDTQKKAFAELIHERIPALIENAGCEIVDDYEIKFTPLEANNSIIIQDESGTEYYSIKAECTLRNRYTGESVQVNIELLRVPVLQELGFKIKGNYMQRLDEYERARGWSFTNTGKNNCAELRASNGRSFSFNYEKSPRVKFMIRGLQKTTVSPSTFLRVISGYSNEQLISMFGYNNPFVMSMLGVQGDNRDIHACIKDVAEAMFGDSDDRTTLVMRNEIVDNLMSRRYFPMGIGNAKRLKYLQSFTYRANGRILAESVNVNGYSFDAGLVLGTQELTIIDALPIKELKVEHNGKIYVLHKFSTFTFDVLGCKLAQDVPELQLTKGKVLNAQDVTTLNQSSLAAITIVPGVEVVRRVDAPVLTCEDAFTAFGIWTDNLNGYDLYEKQFELTNRILVPFDKVVEEMIGNNLNLVISNISNNVSVGNYEGKLALAMNDCYKGIIPDEFITTITNAKKNSGQMSDMCNIMAFVSKSNKATSQMASNSITQDMLNVQDLQEGRLDPLDVPESDKIGRVHYRTLMAKLDDEGNVTTPYLRVQDGAVVSKEPVYLTAMQEADNYIAEWNETFLDENGNKKQRVRTRCNGNVQSVEVSRVTYKEYSPYQNLSAMHSLVPFPGHSNGKRITMACNQGKQAVPLVNNERPFTCGGGESLLDIGTYSIKDVLRDFYDSNKFSITESEDDVMSSNVQLKSTIIEKGTRTLQLEVLNVHSGNNTIEVTIPYLFRNYESAMFSYNINPKKDNIYGPEDILAYNNGYSLDKKELVMCADFGAQNVPDSVFDKGVALVKNLNVVYKTYNGSVIEDGILISSRLVYDDSLTHIGMFEIKETLNTDKESEESFAIQPTDAPEYFETNGLPKVGTYLKPGMPAISKVRRNGNKFVTKYVDTLPYVQGQVISATITHSVKGTEASVWVAQRSSVEPGDKMAGRCGNKGVIARIVPESEMPYIEENGMVADVVLNPLGIPSRQNITQLLEASLSLCMKMDDKIAIVTPYNDNDVDFVRQQAAEHGVVPVTMVDGRSGLRYSRKLNFGVLPMYKLHHVAKRKIHAVGMDAKMDMTFLQPMKGTKQNGGQSFGEMEAWCLESVGATALLQELFTVQSDDAVTRKELIKQQNNGDVFDITGTNCNDLAMQACYRSLGVEFGVNGADYTFLPLNDNAIRALSPYPITNKSMLHSTAIFGNAGSIEERAYNRDRWGWIDLKTKVILPLWVRKGNLPKLTGVSGNTWNDIINGNKYVDTANDSVNYAMIYDEEAFANLSDEGKDHALTGMSAAVWIVEHIDTYSRELMLKTNMDNYVASKGDDPAIYKTDKYVKMLQSYRVLQDFNASGASLADFAVSSFPVMPQTYRPVVKLNGRNSDPDFDWHYMQIINAANAVEQNNNIDTQLALYNAILTFSGLDSKVSGSGEKYQNLLNFFSGKNKQSHGRIRQNMQSKRVLCSGRAAIKPAEDITRTVLELGVPFIMLVKTFAEPLYGYFLNRSVNHKLNKKAFSRLMLYVALSDEDEFTRVYKKYFESAFEYTNVHVAYLEISKLTKDFVEGTNGNPVTAIVAGRQPSLHKYSIRAFRPYVVNDLLIHLHPLLCKGYNADFDGDQMYVFKPLSPETVNEALDKLSPAKDIILPKNGSIVLEHSQDIVLGVYCATMLRDNAEVPTESVSTARYYTSVDTLKTDYLNGDVTPWDLVVLNYNGNRYISTAGRIMFNSLIPGAFTDEPFSNPLRLDGIKVGLYKELKYDGIVGSGSSGVHGALTYYSLPEICREVYSAIGSSCVYVYQDITEFGFLVSDRTGVSLSLEDFDIENDKEQMLKEAEGLKNRVEQDYQDGLISEKDKRNAVIAIYGDNKTGANTLIMQDLLKHLRRNNNIFIMMDSGARGNKSQLMHMCGAVGILQKSKTEDLETSVTRNYYDGLSSFDVHLASYSARTGVASTQNETKQSGYASHQVVYMASGIQIVEDDCGKDDWDFEIEWGEHKDTLDRFNPSSEWFNKNLLGKHVNPDYQDDMKFSDNGVITQDSFERLRLADGFNVLHLREGDVKADIFQSKDAHILDEKSRKITKCVSPNGLLTMAAIETLLNNKVGEVVTSDGTYSLRYVMASSCRSLLCDRVARGLPGLRDVFNRATSEHVSVISDDALDFIEEHKINFIQARTTLNCRSKYGICAHCYGLKFSDEQLPEVGSYVGTESAQSIGEPAAQLTMNVINKGGVAGASSVSSGVQVFEDLLAGGELKKMRKATNVAPNSGYIHIEKMDDSAIVSISPESVESELCQQCLEKNRVIHCPRKLAGAECLCTLKEKIEFSRIIQKDGEWVEGGVAITRDMVHPDAIVSVGDDTSPERVHVRKQRVWINNYYNTFKDSGIMVRARHFELIAYVQNKYVKVYSSGNTDLQSGKVYEFNEVEDVLDDIVYEQMVSKRDDVILRSSGAYAALSFENIASIAANLATSGYKQSTLHNHSLISSLAIGENMKTREMKDIQHGEHSFYYDKKQRVQDAIIINENNSTSGGAFDLQSLDLDALSALNFDEPIDVSETTVTPIVEEIDNVTGDVGVTAITAFEGINVLQSDSMQDVVESESVSDHFDYNEDEIMDFDDDAADMLESTDEGRKQSEDETESYNNMKKDDTDSLVKMSSF